MSAQESQARADARAYDNLKQSQDSAVQNAAKGPNHLPSVWTSPLDSRDTIINRLLDQNDRLITALTSQTQGSTPVQIIQALTPPPAPPIEQPRVDPLASDAPHPSAEAPDSWGDLGVTLEDIRMAGVVTGADEQYGDPDDD